MFVKNSFEFDARVEREARSLAEVGHRVLVVALHVPGVTLEHERRHGFEVVRVSMPFFGTRALQQAANRLSGGAGVDLGFNWTATPGAQTASKRAERSGGGATTRLSGLVRRAVLGVRPVLGPPLRAVRNAVIDARMVRAAHGWGAEVVHAHDLNTLRAGVRAARHGAKLVYDSHELHRARSTHGRLAQRRAAYVERRLMSKVDTVFTASPGYSADLAAHFSSITPITLLNAPELAPFDPRDVRAACGLAAEVPVVLYHGAILPNRGLEQAIDAVATLQGVALVILGYGHHRAVLERLVDERQLSDRVRFFGPVPHQDLVSWVAGADIGLCCIEPSSPSYSLSAPNKLFECFHAGVAVVASDLPVMGAIVQEEGAGIVCDPRGPASIADAINRLLADRDLLGEAAHRARQAAERRYNWGHEVIALLDAYERLATGGRA